MQTDLSQKELLELPPIDRERPYGRSGLSQRTKVMIVASIVSSIILLVAGGAYFYLTRPIVPDVRGMTDSEALKVTQEARMNLIVTGTHYSIEPAGTIISQSPRVGTQPLFARSVKVTLSSGKQAITVPDLIGETELRARSILEQQGLNVQTVYEYAPDGIGKVISMNPEVGQAVETGDIVVLRVGAPQSQVSLVEYDLHGKTVIISVGDDGVQADIAQDIAIRLTSLLQAAQATVITQDTMTDNASAFIKLTTGDHEVDMVYVMGAAQSEPALASDSLPRTLFDMFGQIPVSRGYAHAEDISSDDSVVVLFGQSGDATLHSDTRWKDNIARSIYLALGQTLVR